MSSEFTRGTKATVIGETDTWLTPPELVQSLGRFDLDPCAAVNQPYHLATNNFTIEDDGLNQPWKGRVWLNPPYGRGIGSWLHRLAVHGNGIALVFARTDTKDIQNALGRCTAVLFIAGRIIFKRLKNGEVVPPGKLDRPNAPSMLLAYGEMNADRLRQSTINGWMPRRA